MGLRVEGVGSMVWGAGFNKRSGRRGGTGCLAWVFGLHKGNLLFESPAYIPSGWPS